MKIHYQLVMLFLFLLATACNKKETPHITSVEGKWQLIKITGGIAGADIAIKDKQVAVFQNNEVSFYVNDTLTATNTYQITPIDEQSWKLTIDSGVENPAQVMFRGNLLIMSDFAPDMYTRVYRKID